jgi:gamma-glutamylcyclotransferase (GGCT)/AIG2-like uncharacterized protein YtfP
MMVNSIQEIHTDFLFVYGTLRRGFALHHHLVRMGVEFVGAGVVQAELFDLGKFPGARKSTRPGRVVAGEVYRLRQAQKALKVLDDVEGVLPQAPEKSLFQRARTEVVLRNGVRGVAWIYWLKDRASAKRGVSCGDFVRPRALSCR